MNAIPQYLKQMLYSNNSLKTFVKTPNPIRLCYTCTYKSLPFSKNLDSKNMYQWLIDAKAEPPYIEEGWLTRCNITDRSYLFKSRWVFIKNMKDKKLSTFLIKLLYHILPCKKYLLRWNNSSANNGLCTLCGLPEDYMHMFCTCTRVNSFLQDVQQTILEKCMVNIDFKNFKTVIFGYKQRYTRYLDLNYLIVIVYYTIFKYYCINDTYRINIHMLNNELKIRQVHLLL